MSGVSDRAFEREIMAVRGEVLRYCRMLTNGNREDAEDLLQTVYLKAWAARDQYIAGSNVRAWLFTISRNQRFTDCRRKKFEGGHVEDLPDDLHPAIGGAQEAWIILGDVQRAFNNLPRLQAEVLLARAFGDSYESIAASEDVPIGTIKSRIGRARLSLASAFDRKPKG